MISIMITEDRIVIPNFFHFDILNEHCKGKLRDKIFSINSMNFNDLIKIKHYILKVTKPPLIFL
jgi:hypothetical protein